MEFIILCSGISLSFVLLLGGAIFHFLFYKPKKVSHSLRKYRKPHDKPVQATILYDKDLKAHKKKEQTLEG